MKNDKKNLLKKLEENFEVIHIKNSVRETILDSFLNMNIPYLENLLPESSHMHKDYKTLFLNEIEIIFNRCKELGDSYFIKQSSKCCGENCYKARNSFLLIGNNSKYAFNLILIEDLKEDNYCHYAICRFFSCNTIQNYTIMDETVNYCFTNQEIEDIPF